MRNTFSVDLQQQLSAALLKLEHALAEIDDRDAEIEAAAKAQRQLQAKLDAVMLEYCAGDMTPEQIENWAKSQRAVVRQTS